MKEIDIDSSLQEKKDIQRAFSEVKKGYEEILSYINNEGEDPSCFSDSEGSDDEGDAYIINLLESFIPVLLNKLLKVIYKEIKFEEKEKIDGSVFDFDSRKRKLFIKADQSEEKRKILLESIQMYSPVVSFLGYLYEENGEKNKVFLLYKEYINYFYDIPNRTSTASSFTVEIRKEFKKISFSPLVDIHYRFCILQAPLVVTKNDGETLKAHLCYLINKLSPESLHHSLDLPEVSYPDESLDLPQAKRLKIDTKTEIEKNIDKDITKQEESNTEIESKIDKSTKEKKEVDSKAESQAQKLKELLALLLIQLGQTIKVENTTIPLEADTILHNLNYDYRLSDEVIRYSVQKEECKNQQIQQDLYHSAALSYQNRFCAAVENALSTEQMEYMSKCFGSDDSFSFYKEHGYDSGKTGYFSYLFELGKSPINGIESVIRYIHQHVATIFPTVNRATVAEWWVHKRPHGSGHQLHFDSENEGRGGISALRHPIVSCVLVIDGDLTCGGPTLVTNQRRDDNQLATEGWLLFPAKNRLLLFDGSLLHGVIPGRPLLPSEINQQSCSYTVKLNNKGTTETETETEPAINNSYDNKSKRRITFMVGFWDSIMPLPYLGKPSASQRFPTEKNKAYTWANSATFNSKSLMFDKKKSKEETQQEKEANKEQVEAIHLKTIWKKTKESSNLKDNECPCYDVCFQGF